MKTNISQYKSYMNYIVTQKLANFLPGFLMHQSKLRSSLAAPKASEEKNRLDCDSFISFLLRDYDKKKKDYILSEFSNLSKSDLDAILMDFIKIIECVFKRNNSTIFNSKKFLSVRSFSCQKTDETEEKNEDAVFTQVERSHYWSNELENVTFAISDGATSSPDARTWAQNLVDHSPKVQSNVNNFITELPKLQEIWLKDWTARKETILSSSSSWWLFDALNKPNAATYCSLTLTGSLPTSAHINWKAIAIGDSCLFHFRGLELIKAFPIETPEAFSDRPPLVRSSVCNYDLKKDIKYVTGVAELGDTFILATDAVAKWILEHVINEKNLLVDLLLMNDVYIDFEEIIQKQRDNGRLKDDDSTLVVIGVK